MFFTHVDPISSETVRSRSDAGERVLSGLGSTSLPKSFTPTVGPSQIISKPSSNAREEKKAGSDKSTDTGLANKGLLETLRTLVYKWKMMDFEGMNDGDFESWIQEAANYQGLKTIKRIAHGDSECNDKDILETAQTVWKRMSARVRLLEEHNPGKSATALSGVGFGRSRAGTQTQEGDAQAYNRYLRGSGSAEHVPVVPVSYRRERHVVEGQSHRVSPELRDALASVNRSLRQLEGKVEHLSQAKRPTFEADMLMKLNSLERTLARIEAKVDAVAMRQESSDFKERDLVESLFAAIQNSPSGMTAGDDPLAKGGSGLTPAVSSRVSQLGVASLASVGSPVLCSKDTDFWRDDLFLPRDVAECVNDATKVM